MAESSGGSGGHGSRIGGSAGAGLLSYSLDHYHVQPIWVAVAAFVGLALLLWEVSVWLRSHLAIRSGSKRVNMAIVILLVGGLGALGTAGLLYLIQTQPKEAVVAQISPGQSPGSGGQGAERKPDGAIKAGDGGAGQFYGGGGGGGGGLRVGPDKSIDAGGGGGGGGITSGGHGGGPLGGGGGGKSGFPPGFFETDTGKLLQLDWELKQQYVAEFGASKNQALPEKWVNDQLRKRGSPYTYSIKDGNAVWTKS